MAVQYKTWPGLADALGKKLERAVLRKFGTPPVVGWSRGRFDGELIFSDDSKIEYVFKMDSQEDFLDIWMEWDSSKPSGARRDSGTIPIISGPRQFVRWMSSAISEFKPIVRTVTASRAREAYSYGCLLARFPDPVRSEMIKMAKGIPDDDVFEDEDGEFGREDNPHVTVKYGIHTKDVEDVKKALRGWAPVRVKLGKPSVFKNDDFTVLKLNVSGSELHRLNKQICDELKCTDTHPDYKPHATVAYLNKDSDYQQFYDDSLNGKDMVLDELEFSDADGKKHTIKLEGTPETQIAAELLFLARRVLDNGEP